MTMKFLNDKFFFKKCNFFTLFFDISNWISNAH